MHTETATSRVVNRGPHSAQDTPSSPIGSALSSIQNNLGELEDMAARLISQVSPILQPEFLEPDNSDRAYATAVAAPQSEMETRLLGFEQRIRDVTALLHKAVQRCQI